MCKEDEEGGPGEEFMSKREEGEKKRTYSHVVCRARKGFRDRCNKITRHAKVAQLDNTLSRQKYI